MAQFVEDELVLHTDFPSSRTYVPQGVIGGYPTTANVHRGQRKLLLSEIEFLTKVHVSRLNRGGGDGPSILLPRFLCVYAGACPCTHLDYLLQLFPNVSFVLIDRRFAHEEFQWKQSHWDNKRVAVCAKPFDDCTTHAIAEWVRGVNTNHWIHAKLQSLDINQNEVGYGNLLFISDIRRNAFDENSVAHDMDSQQQWFRNLYASAGLLKFRLPFCNKEWYREYAEHRGVRSYLDGIIYLPIWGPPSTTECRLYVVRGCGVKNYYPEEHESLMAGFESYDRQRKYTVANRVFNSFDEAAEASVLYMYQQCMQHYGYPVRLEGGFLKV